MQMWYLSCSAVRRLDSSLWSKPSRYLTVVSNADYRGSAGIEC